LKKKVILEENLDNFDQGSNNLKSTKFKENQKSGSQLAKNIYRSKSNEMMFFLNRKPESLKEHEKEIIDRVIQIKNRK
jgi:chlorite dismutase